MYTFNPHYLYSPHLHICLLAKPKSMLMVLSWSFTDTCRTVQNLSNLFGVKRGNTLFKFSHCKQVSFSQSTLVPHLSHFGAFCG